MAQKASPKKSATAADPRASQALQNYEAGLRALQEHKFDKAKPLFQKVLAGGSRELSDRATMHLSICNQHLDRSTSQQFKGSKDRFRDLWLSRARLSDRARRGFTASS